MRLAFALSSVAIISYREPRTAFLTSFSALKFFRKADLLRLSRPGYM
jgi:hypothetical protein